MPLQIYLVIYADVSKNTIKKFVASGKSYLPGNIWLSVNFPTVDRSTYSSPADLKYVQSLTPSEKLVSSSELHVGITFHFL